MTIKLRFAPSPTGYLHVGNVRTAIVNWLFAKKSGGEFYLRMDDTDTERSLPKFEAAIIEDMKWLGLGWVGEPIRQCERFDDYDAAKQKLIDMLATKRLRSWDSNARCNLDVASHRFMTAHR